MPPTGTTACPRTATLADALDRPPAAKLPAPVTVVVAADDPHTADFAGRYRDWQFLADQVDLHELGGGGHYFLRTRPAEAARAVLLAVGQDTGHRLLHSYGSCKCPRDLGRKVSAPDRQVADFSHQRPIPPPRSTHAT